MGKNWWEDQTPVQTGGRATNWWEDQAPAAPVAIPSPAMSDRASALGIVKPGTQVGVIKKPAPPPMLARPGLIKPAVTPPAIDPLAPRNTPSPAVDSTPELPEPPEGYSYVRGSGDPFKKDDQTIYMMGPDGMRWTQDKWPELMSMQAAAHQKADKGIAQANQELQNYRNSRPDWMNAVSDTVIGGLKSADQNLFDAVEHGGRVLGADKLSQWMSENVTPGAEKFGQTIGNMIGGQRPESEAVTQMAGATTGGLAEWGSTAVRNPFQAATEATDMLEPTHHVATGYNDLHDSLGALFQGDNDKALEKYKEATPELLMGVAGMLPGGSMTVDALKAAGKGEGQSLASQIFKPGPTPIDRAADLVIKRMQADGLTWDEIASTARSLANRGDNGVFETLSEVAGLTGKSSGANLRGFAQAITAVPGPAQEAMFRRIAENAEKMPGRVSRSASRATGQDASKTASTLDELEKRLRDESVPLYDAFYNSPVNPDIYTKEIAPLLATQQGKQAMGAALRNLRTQEASLKAAVASGRAEQQAALDRVTASIESLAKNQPLTPEALDHVKRAFDDQIEAAGHGSYTASNLRSAKRNFADSVSRATDGTYGQALGFFEGGKRLEEAFDVGLNALKQPTWELQRAMNAGMRGSPFSKGEVEAIALGVARHIDDLVEANDQTALTRLSRGKAIKNIETALGDPKAARQFDQSIKRLMANRQWGRDLNGGSQTELRRQAVREATAAEEDPITRVLDRAETASAPPSLFSAAWSAVGQPAVRSAKDAYHRIRYPGIYNEEINAALAPVMSTPLTAKKLDEIGTMIEGRLAQKGQKRLPPPPKSSPGGRSGGQPKISAPAKALSPPGPKGPVNKNGFGSEGAGAVAGAGAGYALAPDTNHDGVVDAQERAAGALGGAITGGLGVAAVKSAGRALRGPPKIAAGGPPKIAPKSTFRKSWFEAGDGTQFSVHFDDTPSGVDVSFHAEGGPRAISRPLHDEYKPQGTSTLAQANEVYRNVEQAIKDDIAKTGADRYVLHGRTQRQRDLYAQMARSRQPPEGYRWETFQRPGEKPSLTLKKIDASPPPAQNGGPPKSTGATPIRQGGADGGQKISIGKVGDQDFTGTLYSDPAEGLSFHPNYPSNVWNDLGDTAASKLGKNPSTLKRMITPEGGPKLMRMNVSKTEGPKWSEGNVSQIGDQHIPEIDEAVRNRFIGLVKSNPDAPKFSLELHPEITSRDTRRALLNLARDTDRVFVEMPDDTITLLDRGLYNQTRGRYSHGNVRFDEPGAPRIKPSSNGFSFGGGKGPPKPPVNELGKGPPKPKLSPAAEEAIREQKAARSAYNRASNKWVMKDDRELRVKPLEDRVVAADAKVAQVLKNDARLKTLDARARSIISSPNLLKPVVYGSAGAAAGVAGVAALNMFKGEDKAKPPNPRDPDFYWNEIVTKDENAVSQIQLALDDWGVWPEDQGITGGYGKITRAAVKRWRADRGLSPDAPMTRVDVERLLAGPRGYQDAKDKSWRRGDQSRPELPR